MSVAADLLDVNVWVALSEKIHVHYARASAYWQSERSEVISFCRPTMMGMLRMLCSNSAMQGRPFSPPDALAKYRDFASLPDIDFLPEAGFERWLSTWAHQPFFTPKLWTDAWIAAIAMEHGCRVVSFDADFAKFPGLNFLQLTP